MCIRDRIIKEPIQTKGPRLSCELSLAGRYLVLTPFNEVVGVSRKIDSAVERKRLQGVIEQLRPKGFGVIIRTVAEGVPTPKLHEDLNELVAQWNEITKRLEKLQAPQIVYSETRKTNTLLRDVLNASFNNIVANDENIAKEMRDYVKKVSPGTEKMVTFHNNPKSVFEQYGVTKQIKSLFGRTVNTVSYTHLTLPTSDLV